MRPLTGWSGRESSSRRADGALAGRTHERLARHVAGMPVHGGGVSRQLDRGVTVSLLGTLHRPTRARVVERFCICSPPELRRCRPAARRVRHHGAVLARPAHAKHASAGIVRPPSALAANLPHGRPLVDRGVTSTQSGAEFAQRERVRDPPLSNEKLVPAEGQVAVRFIHTAEPQEVLQTPGVGEIEEVLGAAFRVPHHDSQHPRERQRAIGLQAGGPTPAPQRAARRADNRRG